MTTDQYGKQIASRFNKGFTNLGLVHMRQVLGQIEDGTVKDSKLNMNDMAAIWHQAHGKWEAGRAKEAAKKANKLRREETE